MTGVREAGQEKDPEGIFRPAPKEKDPEGIFRVFGKRCESQLQIR
jgi:hypothetical protein